MRSLPSSGIEPEPALQSVIWRKFGDHEGQNMADNKPVRDHGYLLITHQRDLRGSS